MGVHDQVAAAALRRLAKSGHNPLKVLVVRKVNDNLPRLATAYADFDTRLQLIPQYILQRLNMACQLTSRCYSR